jgi:hypothetical protein
MILYFPYRYPYDGLRCTNCNYVCHFLFFSFKFSVIKLNYMLIAFFVFWLCALSSFVVVVLFVIVLSLIGRYASQSAREGLN